MTLLYPAYDLTGYGSKMMMRKYPCLGVSVCFIFEFSSFRGWFSLQDICHVMMMLMCAFFSDFSHRLTLLLYTYVSSKYSMM